MGRYPPPGPRALRPSLNPDSETSPAWSPDGRWLAFATDRDPKQAVFIIPVEDGRPAGPARRVTPPDLAANFPTWSADGRRIAFQAVNDGFIDTMVMPVDGSEPPRLLTEKADTYMARWVWGLDEVWISGKWGGFVNEIRRLDPRGGTLRPFDPPLIMDTDDEWPYFFTDRDGKYVVFADYLTTGDIWLLEADEGVRF